MPVENSPKLDQFNEGIPQRLPDVHSRRRSMRIFILALVVLLAALEGVNLLRTPMAAALRGRGMVTGRVLDESGSPAQAEVAVLGTDIVIKVAADGSFQIPDCPAGNVTLVAGKGATGYAYTVAVPAGGSVDAGVLRLVATLEP